MLVVCENDKYKLKKPLQRSTHNRWSIFEDNEQQQTNICVYFNAYIVAIEARARNQLMNDHTPTALTTKKKQRDCISLHLSVADLLTRSLNFNLFTICMNGQNMCRCEHRNTSAHIQFIDDSRTTPITKCVNNRLNVGMFIARWFC